MKIEIEMPDNVATALFASTQSRNITPAVFVSELVCQALANEELETRAWARLAERHSGRP